MINLSTPSAELWSTLEEEYSKALYWMVKQFGGPKQYELMRDDLLRRSSYGEKSMSSEVIDYTSRAGNRWVCFEHSIYYPESHGSHCMPYALCYYETASSLGVFLLGHDSRGGSHDINCVLIFTPHFFQRFSERMGIHGSQRELLMQFVEISPSMMVELSPDEDRGMKRVVVRYPGCTCHGVKRGDHDRVFEIRTVLSDDQLNPSQERKTAKVRLAGDTFNFEPPDMRKHRYENTSGDAFELWRKDMEKMEKAGANIDLVKEAYGLNVIFSTVFLEMKLLDMYNREQMDEFGRHSNELFRYFFNRREEQGDKFVFFTELIDVAKSLAARMGIRKFDWRQFARLVLVRHFKYTEAQAAITVRNNFP